MAVSSNRRFAFQQVTIKGGKGCTSSLVKNTLLTRYKLARAVANTSPTLPTQVSSLEGRYGGGKATSGSRKKGGKESKRSKKNSPLDLDDAEFERIQQKLVAKR